MPDKPLRVLWSWVVLVTTSVCCIGVSPIHAQSQKQFPGVTGTPNPVLIKELVMSSRILAKEGVLDSYGHVSVRDDRNPARFLLSRRRAASLVAAHDVFEYDLDGKPIVEDKTVVHIWERFIHSEIYRARKDIIAIVHCHAPDLIPFGVSTVPLKPIFHMAAFLGTNVPVYEMREKSGMTDLLIRTPEHGSALAQALGMHEAALMRGHGAVVVGPSLRVVTGRAFYMMVNAKLQTQALLLGGKVTYLDPEEARKAAPQDGYERAWEDWSQKVTGPVRPPE